MVKEIHATQVFVLGEVAQPGVYPLRGGLGGAVDVDPRAEPAALRRQPVVPEVGEQLLHLARQAVDVPPLPHARIVAMARRRAAAGAGVGFLAYLWVAAVRAAPGIRARKAARRSLRRTG